jgi:hypothetical protein
MGAVILFWSCANISANVQDACSRVQPLMAMDREADRRGQLHRCNATTELASWRPPLPQAYCSPSNVGRQAALPARRCKPIGSLRSKVPGDGPSYPRQPWIRATHIAPPALPTHVSSSARVRMCSLTSPYLRCLVIRIGIVGQRLIGCSMQIDVKLGRGR